MTKSMRALGSIAVVFTLAVPVAAWAQAGPRGGTTSSGTSSGGSSGSAGGSSGGSVGEGTRVSPPSGANGAPMGGSSEPSRIPRASSSPSRTVTVSETPRVAPAPGGIAGVAGGEVNASTAKTGNAASRFGATSSFAESASVARSRGDNSGVRGVAGPRPLVEFPEGSLVSFPFYGPWGGWYPWCYSGFGWGLGFVYYDPWFYGPTSWYWGRYGMWYDPYAYFGDPYVTVASSSSSSSSEDKVTFGSLRIKANVSEAKVYVDGALAGVVNEFDGLKDHLELQTGKHSVELRADGYTTVSADVVISKDKTKTVRLELKKAGGDIK